MAMEAFLAQCEGTRCAFMFGPFNFTPSGGALFGNPAVIGDGQTGSTIKTGLSSSDGIKAGDWLQIGFRLVKVTVPPDVSGNIKVWPPQSDPFDDGAYIIGIKPQGLFKLKSNQRSFVSGILTNAPITIEIEEAR